jgi:hypothetical protein
VSVTVARRNLLKRLVGRGQAAAPAGAPIPFPIVPFHLGTCTLVEPATPGEQEAFTRHIQTFRTRAACWEHAPYSDWMLDTLRAEFHHVGIPPERELRVFALDCLQDLTGVDTEPLRDLVAVVKRRIAREASIEELVAVQKRTHATVAPGGVQGLPRLVPHAAGTLAAWHTATPNPYDAAFWAAEFAALHVAFVAVREAAARETLPGAPAGWNAAFFNRARPEIGQSARMHARRVLAVRLRQFLPQPFQQEGAWHGRAVS